MTTILVIEDDPALQEVLYQLLDSEGYTVLLADSGEAGLVTLTYDHVELVIVDLRLPGMDGFAICDRIRASDQPSLPIIVLTANQEPQSVIKSLRLRVNNYITKPFLPDDLFKSVRDALAGI